ncbi:hypothetical protein P4O66_004755 [Electrophorus voltai]|uniref:Reverse transcriptase domain-containing protein n=1 Tax=Electrophorus voltai TaxID=2609070 RepID=A0AAD8YPM0_9TELE|nr:hypothetical protein P4O66_004755 [Electrophorus voltai]
MREVLEEVMMAKDRLAMSLQELEEEEKQKEEFCENLQGEHWYVITNYIYVPPEGVAVAVQLTEAQEPWYRMGSKAVPHVSLALHPKHQAKDLEPMVLRASCATDWVLTQIPNLFYSASCKTYRIEMDGIDRTTLEHRFIDRHHGRDQLDHPDTQVMLSNLPDHLWADSPTDVGLMNCIPIDFQVQQGNPIWIHQYPHKQVTELGIRDMIEGLLQAGVLEPSYSAWNTPILPVEKKRTGKYRMVHDLRVINDILLTPTVPVPNPYVALTNLEPQKKWFTCIDLANPFFCQPLAEQCRDIFSVMFQGRQLRYTRLPQGFALSPGLFNQVLKEALGNIRGGKIERAAGKSFTAGEGSVGGKRSQWEKRGVERIGWKTDLTPRDEKDSIGEAHGVGHVGMTQMMKNLEHWWHPYLKDMAQEVVAGTRGGETSLAPPEVEWVWLKVIKRKWSEPRWTGPFQLAIWSLSLVIPVQLLV